MSELPPLNRVAELRNRIKQLEHELGNALTQSQCEPLIEFAKYIIQCSFDGFNVDGGSAQDKAAELGLIKLERYSIDAHGHNDVGAENGDDWFVFSDLLLPPKAGE